MRSLSGTRAALAGLAAIIVAALSPLAHAASGGAPIAYIYCYNGTQPTSPTSWAPCSGANPVPTTPGSPSPGTYAGNVGGYNVGVAFTPTVQNASYSSGNSLGGLQTIAFFRSTAQPSGIFDNFLITSKGGSTVAMTVYIFDTNPSGSTCTDKSAFSLAVADVAKLAMAPFVLTPAIVGAGTTATTAQLAQNASVKNGDGANVSLYVCLVANGTVTPGSTTDLVGKISGAID